ncbi:MAG: GNAT family protein [Spirochaetales bacterium]|jgi:hypothetical protein|nr:GNAT family protein [Spirochaetales bacterium]
MVAVWRVSQVVYITINKKDIAKIINHPKVWNMVSDDLSQKPYVPIIDDSIIYLINKHKTGLMRTEPVNGITYQIHTTALPELWGKAVGFAKESIEWLFKNTACMKIITFIPIYNKLAIKLAKKSGMEQEGCIKKSFLKGWKLHDQLIYGLTKEQFKEGLRCQQQQ